MKSLQDDITKIIWEDFGLSYIMDIDSIQPSSKKITDLIERHLAQEAAKAKLQQQRSQTQFTDCENLSQSASNSPDYWVNKISMTGKGGGKELD